MRQSRSSTLLLGDCELRTNGRPPLLGGYSREIKIWLLYLNLDSIDVNFGVAITYAATVEADAGNTDPGTGLVATIVTKDD